MKHCAGILLFLVVDTSLHGPMIDARIMIISTRKICISPGVKKKRKRKRNSLTPSPPPSPPSPFLLLERILFSPLFPKLEYLFDLFFFFFKYRKIFWNINKNAHRRWNWRKANYAGCDYFYSSDWSKPKSLLLPSLSLSTNIFHSISRFFEKLDS